MRKIKLNTSNSDRDEELPVDILLTEVFVRLPAPSVVSCMCVCKRWYNSIRKTSFTDFYLKESHLYADSYLICGGEDSFGLVSCKTLNVISNYPYPSKKFSDSSVQIVGSANGLLCLFSFDLSYEPIYLMDPSIRKYKVVNSSAIVHRTIGIDTRVMLGFGYHQKSKDYKIVRFLERQRVRSRYTGESDVEVYSLCSDAWKEIQVQYFPWIVRDEASSVVCNENLHWIAHNCDRDDQVILSFNFEKYVLEEVKLPDLTFHTDSTLTVTAVVLKECLGLFGYVLPVGSGEGSTGCYLWIMKDYGVAESWTKLYEIDCQVKIRRCISSTRDAQLILEDIHENILLYNTETKSFDNLNIPEKQFLVKVVPYMESLILIDQKNEVLTIQSPGREHIREFICSEDEDSDDLEQFSEDYSNDDEASEEDYLEISDGEVSEGYDKELSKGSDSELSAYHDEESSNQVLNCALKVGDKCDEGGEKDKQLPERPSDNSFACLVNEDGSSDCILKPEDKTSCSTGGTDEKLA